MSLNDIKTYLDRITPPTLADGRIVSLNGMRAKVQISGVSGYAECDYPTGASLSVGDHVLLFRPAKSSTWIIASGFAATTMQTSASPILGRGKKFELTDANQAQELTALGNGMFSIYSFDILTHGGDLLIGYSGYAIHGGATATTECSLSASIDGRNLAPRGWLTRIRVGTGQLLFDNLNFTVLEDTVSPGRHTISLLAGVADNTAVATETLFSAAFWAAEV